MCAWLPITASDTSRGLLGLDIHVQSCHVDPETNWQSIGIVIGTGLNWLEVTSPTPRSNSMAVRSWLLSHLDRCSDVNLRSYDSFQKFLSYTARIWPRFWFWVSVTPMRVQLKSLMHMHRFWEAHHRPSSICVFPEIFGINSHWYEAPCDGVWPLSRHLNVNPSWTNWQK